MRTGYLGPQGSYSYLASKIMTSESEFIPFDSFPKLMHALCRGEVDCTVIPIENTLTNKISTNILAVEEKARKIKGVLESPSAEKIPVAIL